MGDCWVGAESLKIQEGGARLSRAEKKTAKRERIKAKWAEEKKAKKMKRLTNEGGPPSPPTESRDPTKTKERRDRKDQAAAERKREEGENPEILIDCDFHELMTEKEQTSIASQLLHCYSIVKKTETRPMRLALCGVHGELLARFKKSSGFANWSFTIHEHKIEDDGRDRENFIYLTADAQDELDLASLTKDHVLVIGGFVDRNRHKGLTFKKAQELGVRTAKLPLGNFVHLIGSQVLTVNHVVDILTTAYTTRDWQTAVQKVVPERKVVLAPSSL